MSEAITWRNRIVGHGDEPLDEILFNPANWRVHPKQQQTALEGVLSQVGYVQDVIINRTTGHLVDGHLRCQVAARNGEKTIPAVYVELDENEEALILASLDPIAAMAATDRAKLDELMAAVQSDDARVQQMMADIAEKEGLEYGKVEPPDDPGAQIDKAEELRVKWGVESGQLWQLGEHRLVCGDCTDKATVERVMGNDLATMVWTDPPYGVSYGDKLEASNPMGYRVRSIENDSLPPAELEELIRSAFRNCADHSIPGAAIYAACPAGTPLPTAIAAFVGSGFDFRWQLVWVKDQIVLSRADYHFQHENILYGWKSDAGHHWEGDRKQSSCFFIDRPKKSEEHPTMKPIELVERMLENNSERGSVVIEPFSGSGTTLIACERLGRKCRAVEISPAYVAVALERWATMTGKTPEIIE